MTWSACDKPRRRTYWTYWTCRTCRTNRRPAGGLRFRHATGRRVRAGRAPPGLVRALRGAGDGVVVDHLCFAPPPRRLPPEVRIRLMDRVAREGKPAPLPSAARVTPPPSVDRRARRHVPLPRWVWAAALLPWIVAAGLGAALVAPARTPGPTPTLAVASIAGARGITGRLALDPGGTNAFLAITHMPRLRSGTVYVCWLKRGGRVDYACTFELLPRSDDGYVRVSARQPLRTYASIGITVERATHPARPSAPFLAGGSLR